MNIEQNVDFGDSELSVQEVSGKKTIGNVCLTVNTVCHAVGSLHSHHKTKAHFTLTNVLCMVEFNLAHIVDFTQFISLFSYI